MKDTDLIYTGMHVTLADWENRLYGCLLNDYKEYGRLTVGVVYEDNTVQLTCGGSCVNFHKALLQRYDEDIDILRVLKNKKNERDSLEKEIEDIEKYIKDTCNKRLKSC
jgi:hypothetical protein